MFVTVWSLDLQLPMESALITTEVVNSNPAHGEVYSIHHYVIKCVSDLRLVGSFLRADILMDNIIVENVNNEIPLLP